MLIVERRCCTNRGLSAVALAPNAPIRAAMLARVPFAFTLGYDAIAVDDQVVTWHLIMRLRRQWFHIVA